MAAPVQDPRTQFPSGGQALLLVLALFVLELVAGALPLDARGPLGLGRGDREALTVLLLVPAAVLLLGSLTELLVRIFPLSRWEDGFFRRVVSGDIASFVMVCLLAPVLEEMPFRGVILRGFLQRYPRGQAILGSAILFGAAHLNLYQFFVGLLLGTLAGWLYERARSLVPGIALHMGYNTAVWGLAVSALPADGAQAAMPEWTDSPAAWIVATISALLGLRLLWRLLVRPAWHAEAGR